MESDEITKRFTRHPRDADNDRSELLEIQDALRGTGQTINRLAPDGREESLAITKLEEAHM